MNTHIISKTQFKARALALFRQVEETGEPIIITDRGQPVLELRPTRAANADPLAKLRGSLLSFDRPCDPVGEEDWQALA